MKKGNEIYRCCRCYEYFPKKKVRRVTTRGPVGKLPMEVILGFDEIYRKEGLEIREVKFVGTVCLKCLKRLPKEKKPLSIKEY